MFVCQDYYLCIESTPLLQALILIGAEDAAEAFREGVPGFSAVFRWIFFYDSFFKGFSKVPKGSPYNKKTPRGRGFPVSIDPPCVFVTMSNFLFGIVKPKSCRVICIYTLNFQRLS